MKLCAIGALLSFVGLALVALYTELLLWCEMLDDDEDQDDAAQRLENMRKRGK